MHNNDLRRDILTAAMVQAALTLKSVLGQEYALSFMLRERVPESVIRRVLSEAAPKRPEPTPPPDLTSAEQPAERPPN